MSQQKQSNKNLPKSDHHIFDGADKIKVDKKNLKNILCKKEEDHDYYVNYGLRECQCRKCGLGFRFKVSDMEIVDGVLRKKA
jgi:hypothetical protein